MNIPKPISKQPLPEHAQKVFTGKMFDVYQWKQKLYDGTYTTFEKIKRPDTVVIFPITNDGKIILTEQGQPGKEPFIGGAGGRVDEGEDIVDAVQRELKEETGYKAKTIEFWKGFQPISKMEWNIYFFFARGLSKVSNQALDGGEKIELIEVSFEEFIEIGLQPNFSEYEIYRDLVEAKLNNSNFDKLKALFLGILSS